MPNMSRLTVSLVWFFIAITFLIQIDTLYDGHNWGGDFAQYILSAKNLLEGRPYNDHILLDMTITYPPGFSFLLMPLIKMFGINFKIFKLLNVLFWYLSVVFGYFLFKKEVGRDVAILSSLLLSILSGFFIFKQNILSDIPFAFFTILVIWCFRQYEDCQDNLRLKKFYFFLFVIFLAFSLLIRSAGLITFLSAICYLLYLGKRKEPVYLIVSLIVTLLFQFSITGIYPGKLSDVYTHTGLFFKTLLTQADQVWLTIYLIFIQHHNAPLEAVFTLLERIIPFVSPFLYGYLMYQFINDFLKKRLNFIKIFVFFNVLFLCFMFGFPNNPWGMGRYVYPNLIPLMITLAWTGKKILRTRSENAGKIVLFILVVINIYNVKLQYHFNDDVLRQRENRELIAWIRNNVKDDEPYMLWQALPMALFTGKVGTGEVWRAHPMNPDFHQYVKQNKIAYLILTDPIDRGFIGFYQSNPRIAKLVWANDRYYAFKLSVI